ncbi:MAG: hypothetical protein M1826_003422 [Phylliscum demangeonii]|nr:MAG: hypothetical protein M1826_003422 [Phylliscum demangeonii]
MDMSTSSSSTMHVSSMAMTFFQSNQTPLYALGWTPHSTAAYAGSCIFLILLAFSLRSLMAVRLRLERYWLDRHLNRRYVVVAGRGSEKDRVALDAGTETALLISPAGHEEDVRVVRRHVRALLPWRLSVDLPRALLVTLLAAVAYLLMLAVMTYNVGYLLSVLAGVFLGELVMGRFAPAEEH